MSERVVRDGFEIPTSLANLLDEFGMTDEEVDEMWDCALCGGPMGAGANFDKGLCRECVESGEDGE